MERRMHRQVHAQQFFPLAAPACNGRGVCFACLPFSYPPLPSPRELFDALNFFDAAPDRACSLRVGPVPKCGMWKSQPNPSWVGSLQAAGLWAKVGAMLVAAY